jgi:hypothetical protein
MSGLFWDLGEPGVPARHPGGCKPAGV